MSGYRLRQGGLIDRTKPYRFAFDGTSYTGFAGDTLASALLANGVDIVARSFKYHRPRGLLAAGLDEPNALVQLERGAHTVPNLKATGVELYDGLSARSVNAWPRAAFDLGAVNSLLARFIPAAFYYKTFMWPDWHLFEPAIRKAAGLGKAPTIPDEDVYDKRYHHCDVLIIGAGPSGLAAARAAARAGAKVMLVEQDSQCGGHLLAHDRTIDDVSGNDWAQATWAEIADAPNAMALKRTMAFGYYDHNLVALSERLTDHLPPHDRSGARQRLWKVRAKTVILATGAIERPLVFGNNDRPGVMLANAALTYAKRFGAAPGRRAVLAANNDSAYDAALGLQHLGVEIEAILDARSAESPAMSRAAAAGLEVRKGSAVLSVRGMRRVSAVTATQIDADNCALPGTSSDIACDTVLMAGGWSPVVHLFSQSGGKLRFDEPRQAFVPKTARQTVICVGTLADDASLSAAALAGKEAARAAGHSKPIGEVPQAEAQPQEAVQALWQVDTAAIKAPKAKAWVDYQNDVTSADVSLAVRENFTSVEHVKRYTTLGMASDQGKTSNVNGIGVMHALLDKPIAQVGTTTFRPPYDPVPFGALAGRRVGGNLDPARLFSAHGDHLALGAEMEEYGPWRRPAYYKREGEDKQAAINREALSVRSGVGLFESSSLGKIEVYGPDAAELLTRVYINNMKSLKVGRCRYGLMLSEHGIVFDDGVLARMGDTRFLVGTTSGNASAVHHQLRTLLQLEWPDLDVVCEDVTTAWAVMTLTGPKARALLETLECDIDLSKAAFGHMQYRQGTIEGVPCRMQRVSFTGEISFEVSVPWGYGAALWSRLMAAGEALDVTPFGIEALMILRTEKGYLHLGSDTDGTTMPQDLGFGRVIEKKESDFIGRRSTMRPDAQRARRRQLIGLEALDGKEPLAIGAHLIAPGETAPARSQGWVTSSVYSPTLDKPIAMAMLEDGFRRDGDTVQVWDMDTSRTARVVPACAYDRQGSKIDV